MAVMIAFAYVRAMRLLRPRPSDSRQCGNGRLRGVLSCPSGCGVPGGVCDGPCDPCSRPRCVPGTAYVDRDAGAASAGGQPPRLPVYKIGYSVVSIVGIVLIRLWPSRNTARTGWIDVWYPPSWTRHVTVALMWPACICVVAAYIPGDIKRHAQASDAGWHQALAFAHLISNGDLGSIVLFGGILAWAVFDRISLKRRRDGRRAPIPIGGRRNDVIAIVVGTVLYLVLGLWFHPLAIGVYAFRHAGNGKLICPAQEPIRRLTALTFAPARMASRSSVSHPITPTPRGWWTVLRRHPGRRLARHGDARPGDHRAGDARDDGPARPRSDAGIEQGAGGGRYAVRLLRSLEGAAFMNAARVMKETGCGAIKVEGGRRLAETIAFLAERGVPVMGHVGLTRRRSTPSVRSALRAGRRRLGPIEDDAKAVADAGAFALVIEAVAEPLGRRITEQVSIPTIGIGASAACDGQILVLEDMLGCLRACLASSSATVTSGLGSRLPLRATPRTCGRAPSRGLSTSTA